MARVVSTALGPLRLAVGVFLSGVDARVEGMRSDVAKCGTRESVSITCDRVACDDVAKGGLVPDSTSSQIRGRRS